MPNNSVGELGTLRITIFLPSVEPIPIDANERTDIPSENIRPDPASLNTYEPVLDKNCCVGWATIGLDIALPC